jgi:hypothetical protein
MDTISKELRALLPQSFVVKAELEHPQWKAYIDFINSFGGSYNGDSADLYYGLRYHDRLQHYDFPIAEVVEYLPENITILTISEVLNTIGMYEIPIAMVTTYDGEEHPRHVCVQIHEDSRNHPGEWALEIDCKYADYNEGYVLEDDVTYVRNHGCVIQGTEDNYDICYSSFLDELVDTNDHDVVYGYVTENGRTYQDYFITSWSTVEIDDEYYRCEDSLRNQDYIYSERQNEWVYQDNWESGHHDWDDDDDDDDEPNNAEYHRLTRLTRFDSSAKFTVGFEIEKEDSDMVDVDYGELYHNTGWIKEKDGSLNSCTGYELVTPAFNLFDDQLEIEIGKSQKLRDLINAEHSSDCGGHINIGSTIYNTEQLFEGISGFFPLFYAMYEHRITKTYSKAKKKHEYYNRDKYSSIYIKPNVVEIRIPSAVRNINNLLWRRDLIRIIVDNFNKSEHQVLRMLANTKSKLHIHLRQVYSLDQMIQKIEKFIKYSDEFNNKKLPNVNTARLVDKKSLGA